MTLALSIGVASLLGSLHCAAMCGPFVGLYSGGSDRRSFLPHISYNLGRLVTYALLGAVAGTLGRAVDLAGSTLGITQAAGVISGILIAAFGLSTLLRARRSSQGGFLDRWLERVAPTLLRFSSTQRAALLGLCSSLLPCGWLYAFAVAAAGTGSASSGALVLAAFWAGTLPAMLGLGISLTRLSAHVRGKATLVASFVLIALGLASVFGRVNLPAFSVRGVAQALENSEKTPRCH